MNGLYLLIIEFLEERAEYDNKMRRVVDIRKLKRPGMEKEFYKLYRQFIQPEGK